MNPDEAWHGCLTALLGGRRPAPEHRLHQFHDAWYEGSFPPRFFRGPDRAAVGRALLSLSRQVDAYEDLLEDLIASSHLDPELSRVLARSGVDGSEVDDHAAFLAEVLPALELAGPAFLADRFASYCDDDSEGNYYVLQPLGFGDADQLRSSLPVRLRAAAAADQAGWLVDRIFAGDARQILLSRGPRDLRLAWYLPPDDVGAAEALLHPDRWPLLRPALAFAARVASEARMHASWERALAAAGPALAAVERRSDLSDEARGDLERDAWLPHAALLEAAIQDGHYYRKRRLESLTFAGPVEPALLG